VWTTNVVWGTFTPVNWPIGEGGAMYWSGYPATQTVAMGKHSITGLAGTIACDVDADWGIGYLQGTNPATGPISGRAYMVGLRDDGGGESIGAWGIYDGLQLIAYTNRLEAYIGADEVMTLTSDGLRVWGNPVVTNETSQAVWTYALPLTNWGVKMRKAAYISQAWGKTVSGVVTAQVYRQHYTNAWLSGATLLGSVVIGTTGANQITGWAAGQDELIGVYFNGGQTQQCVFGLTYSY